MFLNLKRSIAAAAMLAVAACQMGPAQEPVTEQSAHIIAAIADPARPQDADATAGCLDQAKPCTGVKLDAFRKPAAMLAFSEVRPGQKVGELIPGAGYMTRLFSKAVGPTGKVYVFTPAPQQREGQPPPPKPIAAIQDDKTNYANVSVTLTDLSTIPTPESLDLVWTSQNYHDMHNPGRNLDINAANKAVLAALKPGGLYIVLDHQSAKGVDFDATKHRIDMAKVKQEVVAAGFEFVGESTALANPADDGTKGVFDPSVRRQTNQFILKFRKPG
jgi:predicted methyltransferase